VTQLSNIDLKNGLSLLQTEQVARSVADNNSLVSIVATSDLLHLGRMEAKKITWIHAKSNATPQHNKKK